MADKIKMPKLLLCCLLAMVSLTAALECPLVTCGPLRKGVCATKVDDTTIQLNSESCPEGRFCSGQRLYEDWWWYATTDSADEYPCWDDQTFHQYSYSEYINATVWPCGYRVPNRNLKEGSDPKVCASDHDCLLADGSLGHCYCSMQQYSNSTTTTGICSPDLSSDLFAATWSLCSGTDMTDVRKGNRDLAYQRVYHILQSDAPCAETLLWEFAAVKELDAIVAAGSAGGLALAGALSLLV